MMYVVCKPHPLSGADEVSGLGMVACYCYSSPWMWHWSGTLCECFLIRSHDCTRCHVTFKMFVVEISLQSQRRSRDCTTSLSMCLPSNACCCADFSTISWKVSWLHHLIVNVFTFKCLLLCRFLYNLMEGLMTAPPHCQCVNNLQMLVVVQISLQSHGRSHDCTTSLSMC